MKWPGYTVGAPLCVAAGLRELIWINEWEASRREGVARETRRDERFRPEKSDEAREPGAGI